MSAEERRTRQAMTADINSKRAGLKDLRAVLALADATPADDGEPVLVGRLDI